MRRRIFSQVTYRIFFALPLIGEKFHQIGFICILRHETVTSPGVTFYTLGPRSALLLVLFKALIDFSWYISNMMSAPLLFEASFMAMVKICSAMSPKVSAGHQGSSVVKGPCHQ